MTRSVRLPALPLAALVVVLTIVLTAVLGAVLPAPAVGATPGAADPRPTAIVALGDSAAAGDGAGDYEPGTRGEGGNWCHRSPHAFVHRTGLAAASVNLACSGARSADVAFGAPGRYTEGSQAERLIEVAGRFRVTAVVVQLGANDDAALTATGIACIRAFLDPTVRPCRETLAPLVADRMAATAAKVEAAVGDVRTAMRRAGYRDGAYDLVLMSYASPVTERMVGVQGVLGCPYSRPDAGWGRTVLFPGLSAALAGVAERTGARFVDMARATEGFEACSRAAFGEEWQRRLTVSAEAFAYGGLDAAGYHLAQESFHPAAAGHAQFGRCLGEFVRSALPAAACVPAQGGLQVRSTAADPAA